MKLIGTYYGYDLYRRADGVYFVRVESSQKITYETVHSLAYRSPLGRYDNAAQAIRAIERKVGVPI